MPAKYKRCVAEVMAKKHSSQQAHAICTSVDAGGVKEVRKKEAKEKKGK